MTEVNIPGEELSHVLDQLWANTIEILEAEGAIRHDGETK